MVREAKTAQRRRCALLPAACCVLALLVTGCVEPPLKDHALSKALPTPEDHLLQGQQYLKQNDFANAKFHFLTVINQNGPQAEALVGLGMIEETQDHLFEAERLFRRAIAISDTSVSAYNSLGVVLFRQKNYHEAREAFRLAFALSSGENGTAAYNLRLAELAVEQSNYEQFGIPVDHQLRRMGSNEYLLQSKEALLTAANE